MADLVYPPVIGALKTWFALTGMKVHVHGAEHIPAEGPVVIASTHTSYLDFVFAGLAGVHVGRLTRFMAKESVFTNKVSGPLMRGMHHIPVDRQAGSASFRAALTALKQGEVVGIFPEATISRSFTVKELKSGAIRMAQVGKAPLVPVAVWGGQRLMTKGRPPKLAQRGRSILINVGEPVDVPRSVDGDELTALLRSRMQALLDDAQARTPDQPRPGEDAWWHPAHLGGSAPTPAEAAALDASDREDRIARGEAPEG